MYNMQVKCTGQDLKRIIKTKLINSVSREQYIIEIINNNGYVLKYIIELFSKIQK